MSTHPRTITVLQADDVVAVCTVDRVFLGETITALPPKHPDRIHAEAKCLVAGAILRGDIDGPYDDQEAGEAARILIRASAGEPF